VPMIFMAQKYTIPQNYSGPARDSLTSEDLAPIVPAQNGAGWQVLLTLTSPTQPNPIPVKKKGLDHAR
jgi:hypothetical protein